VIRGRRPAVLSLFAATLFSASAYAARAHLAGNRRQNPDTPPLTVLYQNFPNPFPAPGVDFTCIWFDLHRASQVRLTIHDVRGALVRAIVPSPFFSSAFPAGRFGRGNPDTNVGCDPRFRWDGNDSRGRAVSPGVYLVRLKTERFEGIKRIVFRGR